MAWANKEKEKSYNKKYRELNGDRIRKQQTQRFKEKYHNDPLFKENYLEKARKYSNANSQRRLKLRFSIFKRDSFTCQYCGRKAPDVVLQIDHIHPKSKGGLNKAENYRTACFECNIGKGDCLL